MKKTLLGIIASITGIVCSVYYNDPPLLVLMIMLFFAFTMYFVAMYWPTKEDEE